MARTIQAAAPRSSAPATSDARPGQRRRSAQRNRKHDFELRPSRLSTAESRTAASGGLRFFHAFSGVLAPRKLFEDAAEGPDRSDFGIAAGGYLTQSAGGVWKRFWIKDGFSHVYRCQNRTLEAEKAINIMKTVIFPNSLQINDIILL